VMLSQICFPDDESCNFLPNHRNLVYNYMIYCLLFLLDRVLVLHVNIQPTLCYGLDVV
jgi:hypothetical protein